MSPLSSAVMRPSFTHYLLSVVTCGLAFSLGAAIIGGGDIRWSAPSLRVAAELAPHWVWGLWLSVSAMVLATGIVYSKAQLRIVANAAMASWGAFFAGTLSVSAVTDPHVPFTGPFVYTWVAAVCIVLARTDAGQIKNPE